MVKGTVTLKDGQQVKLIANDMLNAMWLAESQYHGLAKAMHFEAVEVIAEDGGCKVDQTGNGVAG